MPPKRKTNKERTLAVTYQQVERWVNALVWGEGKEDAQAEMESLLGNNDYKAERRVVLPPSVFISVGKTVMGDKLLAPSHPSGGYLGMLRKNLETAGVETEADAEAIFTWVLAWVKDPIGADVIGRKAEAWLVAAKAKAKQATTERAGSRYMDDVDDET